MEKDQVISAIGDWGPWQFRHVFLVATATMFATWPSLIITYTNAPSDHWCARPEKYANMTVEAWREMSSPLIMEGGKMVRDRCHIWKKYQDQNGEDISDDEELGDNSALVACDKWEHDKETFTLTTIQQWDLVCHRQGYQNFAQSAFFAGMLVGTLCVGMISDRFGRRMTLVPCLMLTILVGALLPLSPDVNTFIALRFLHGMAKIGFFVTAFVWNMEVVGGRWQTYIGIGIQFPWVAAWVTLCAYGWMFKGNWRVIQWVTSLPGVITVVLWWLIPESPKWLLAAGRLEDAEDIIKKVAKRNKRELPEDWKLQPLNLNNNSAEEETKGGCVDLFRRRNLALWTLVIFFNWFANSFVYYGLTLNSGSIGGSYQLNFFLNGIFELPAYTITLYVLLKCGRRLPYVVLMLLGAACLLCTTLVSNNNDDDDNSNWAVVALAMAGKFCVTGTFGIIYVYSAEVFPTVVRSVGVGTASVFARVGGAVAPYVGSLHKVFTPTVPIAIFGMTALAAAVTALMLPETRDSKLPDTLDEGNEKMRRLVIEKKVEENEQEEEEEREKMQV